MNMNPSEILKQLGVRGREIVQGHVEVDYGWLVTLRTAADEFEQYMSDALHGEDVVERLVSHIEAGKALRRMMRAIDAIV